MRNARQLSRGRRRPFVSLLGLAVVCSLIVGSLGPGFTPAGRVAARDDPNAAGTPIAVDPIEDTGETSEVAEAPAPEETGSDESVTEDPPADGTPAPDPETDPTADGEASSDGSDESPPVEIPAGTPEVVVPIDILVELSLPGLSAEEPVELDYAGVATIAYRYLVTADRTSTTIHAELLDAAGAPAPGWTVSLNDLGPDLIDIEHVIAGSEFPLNVTVHRDETVEPETTAHLRFTVTIDLVAPGATDAGTFAAASIEVAPTGEQQTDTVDGPLFQAEEGGFGVASVSPPDNNLTCHNANSYGSGTLIDALVPGQIIRFDCDLALAGISLLPTFSGTATITIPSPNPSDDSGWKIMAPSQVGLLGIPLLAPTGTWSSSSVNLSGLGVLELTDLLNAGGLSFSIWVQAPFTPLPFATDAVSISVGTTCYATLGLVDCLNRAPLLGYDATATATLTAQVADIQTADAGGGGITDLGILGGLGSALNGGLIFRLYCDTPASGTQIRPGQTVKVTCYIQNLADLTTLNVASLGADITVSFSDPSSSWSITADEFTLDPQGVVNLDLGALLDTSVVNSQYPFHLNVTYTPASCVTTPITGQPLNALRVTADYELNVLNLPVVGGSGLLALSQGWATVPFQLEGTSDRADGIAPVVSGNALNFGTFTYDGSGYTGGLTPNLVIDLAAPTTNCTAADWHVTAAYSTLTGYADAGYVTPLAPATSIPVTSISYSGAPTGGTGTITPLTPAPTGGADVIITGTDDLATAQDVTYTLQLAPPDTQRVGFYRGTVTITAQAGAP